MDKCVRFNQSKDGRVDGARMVATQKWLESQEAYLTFTTLAQDSTGPPHTWLGEPRRESKW